MSATIPKSVFTFLKELKKNNHRDWIQENKKKYRENEETLKKFFTEVEQGLKKFDAIENKKIFRINRDIRFSKDKTPYNTHRSASFKRELPAHRGGYYIRIEPGNSMMAGGFFNPEAADLLRIRKEFERDASEIRKIFKEKEFKKVFGDFNQDNRVKTAPKGFNKDDENIDLIRLKSFFVVHKFTDKQVMDKNFQKELLEKYEMLLPFFNYMSEVLTTDLNGVSLIDVDA
ncbi:DUF2461 domain-containing protein [Luteirhabdus pelagi]|uniref:DUF2461 domain-containing protein n=1 Tax=Luteirhabdus pelagi TaxID=2792783 RepID=UPI00193A0F92|nr:DUF2461 domain-containing protein [Luteirhabdus pelagi]